MAKKKGGKKSKEARIVVTLECTEAKAEGATPSRYTTTKNRRNTTARLELRKYNPYLRRYTLHKEIK
jgi:large subunit ribosomal protein L33